jgi:hypothetical protein
MLRVKHPKSVPIAILCGHQYASTQKFASALREYQRAHAQRPEEPLISLCIGGLLLLFWATDSMAIGR